MIDDVALRPQHRWMGLVAAKIMTFRELAKGKSEKKQ